MSLLCKFIPKYFYSDDFDIWRTCLIIIYFFRNLAIKMKTLAEDKKFKWSLKPLTSLRWVWKYFSNTSMDFFYSLQIKTFAIDQLTNFFFFSIKYSETSHRNQQHHHRLVTIHQSMVLWKRKLSIKIPNKPILL